MIKNIMKEMMMCRKAISFYNGDGYSTEMLSRYQGRYEAYKNVLEMMGCNVREIEQNDGLALCIKINNTPY